MKIIPELSLFPLLIWSTNITVNREVFAIAYFCKGSQVTKNNYRGILSTFQSKEPLIESRELR